MQAQDLIKSWAKEGGRKFAWIAAQVPVTPNTMSAWMNGHAIPNAVCRNRLADITGTDVRESSAWGEGGKRSADDYRGCAERGLSKSAAARELGVTVQCVDNMSARHGIAFKDGRKWHAEV